MKSRHQGRALPACGDIAAAKVGHHGNACEFGQQGRAVELQGVARAIKHLRPVAHGLAMGANGSDSAALATAGLQQLAHHLGVMAHQRIGGQCGAVQFVAALGAVQSQQFAAQRGIKTAAGVLQHLRALREIDQHAIHTIKRSAGHQANVERRQGGVRVVLGGHGATAEVEAGIYYLINSCLSLSVLLKLAKD